LSTKRGRTRSEWGAGGQPISTRLRARNQMRQRKSGQGGSLFVVVAGVEDCCQLSLPGRVLDAAHCMFRSRLDAGALAACAASLRRSRGHLTGAFNFAAAGDRGVGKRGDRSTDLLPGAVQISLRSRAMFRRRLPRTRIACVRWPAFLESARAACCPHRSLPLGSRRRRRGPRAKPDAMRRTRRRKTAGIRVVHRCFAIILILD